MAIEGWYYLHTNGELIYKRDLDGAVADLRESDFVRHFWPCDPTDREGAWNILVEALALGASPSRVNELAIKWQCNDEDALVYAERLQIKLFKRNLQSISDFMPQKCGELNSPILSR
jgi:hypothetical protein